MVNRRIILFALIIVLGLTVLTIGKNMISGRLSAKDEEIQFIRSDDEITVIVEEEEGVRKTVMYFSDKDGYLIPVMRKIPWEEGIAKTTLKNMVDSPSLREELRNIGLTTVIPAGTEILGISINEETGLCKVDFSDNVLNNQSDKEEENFIKGVVYTLTEFPAVKEVQILVGGKTPNMKYGNIANKPIQREDINLIGKLEHGSSKVIVYYKGMNEEEYEYFVPVTVPTLAPVANVYSALDILFDGPPENTSLFSDMPKSIMLNGVEVKDGVAYVDVTYEDEFNLGGERIQGDILKNIGLTLSQFKEIETVELLIDGEIINSAIPVFANEY